MTTANRRPPLRVERLEDRLAPAAVATATTVVSGKSPSAAGEQVTFTATVSAKAIAFGVAGDSLSDEYAETAGDSGVDNYSYAKNWNELLVAHRGFNFGPTGTWGEPRRTKFEYNWARAGADSTTLLIEGQHSGLAAQVQGGLVDFAVLAIGQNDFYPDASGAYFSIYSDAWTATQIQDYKNAVVGNIKTAIDTLVGAGVRLVVSDIIDYGIAPLTQQFFTDPGRRDQVSAVITDINTQVIAYCQSHSVPVVDLYALSKFYFGPNSNPVASRQIGGVTINNAAGVDVNNAFVADGIHPHTVVQAVMANTFLEGWRLGYGAEFLAASKFSERNIVEMVGLTYTQDTLNLDYGGYVILPQQMPPQVGKPTGSVQFKVDGNNFGSPVNLAPGAGNTAAAQLGITFTTTGTHTVAAEYIPTGSFSTSTGSTPQVVGGAAIIATGTGAGGGPHVKVFDAATGALKLSFLAYDGAMTAGVRVATGDINGDGTDDVITGPGAGAGPHVKVFSGLTGAEIYSFFAYSSGFVGGVYVASGDVDNDGRDDIITGVGSGGGPHVRAFSGATSAEIRSFMAYDPSFSNGVRVAAGDINNDGFDDVITGAGPGGGPHVQVFSGANQVVLRSFMAYDGFTGGVYVGAGDINGDGFDDIITGAGPGAGAHVKTFNGGDLSLLQSFLAYEGFTGGVQVGAADVDGDGDDDLLVGAGPGGGPHVRAFRADLALLRNFMAYDTAFTGGVFVG